MRIFKPIFLALFISFMTISVSYAKGNNEDSKGNFKMPENIVENEDYLSKTVVLRIKPEYRHLCENSKILDDHLIEVLFAVDVTSLKKRFPEKPAINLRSANYNANLVDLSLIYTLKYHRDIPVEDVINKLYASDAIMYAEPWYLPKLFYTPNDPDVSFQNSHLSKIQAFQAWDITKGDSNIVIAITDAGGNDNHPDLKDNLKYNYADPINGTDDDGDGFVDNFAGWDVADDDNDPNYGPSDHGTHVIGLAAASTDNGIGVTGTGFNCKYLPVKISDDTGALIASYDGIVYAADHGADVINCSWGGPVGGFFSQNIINYAFYNKDAVIVAACGNDGGEDLSFPAGLNNVISVANTGSNDRKNSSSNYGVTIDCTAPGGSAYSTLGASYGPNSGTSMSSPIVAGVVGLIRSKFPSYNAERVTAQLKATCDPIDRVQFPQHKGKLGSGRINAFRAVSETDAFFVKMTGQTITDGNDDAFVVGDTLKVTGWYKNFLSPTSNLTATLSSTSSYVKIVDGTSVLGVVNPLDSVNNNSDPFIVVINPSAPINREIQFLLTFNDQEKEIFEYFFITVNVDFINISLNEVKSTITSNGQTGYNKPEKQEGQGLKYNGKSILYEAGLMIGTNHGQVSDMVRSAGAFPDTDFEKIIAVHKEVPSVKSEFDLSGSFNDSKAPNPLNIEVEHNAYAWSTVEDSKYFIVEYIIKNQGPVTLNDLYAGIFADWDIDSENEAYRRNRTGYDEDNKMGYVFQTDPGGIYGGMKLLTNSAPPVHHGIKNDSTGILWGFGYPDSLKYVTLTTNVHEVGMDGSGTDVHDVMSTGPISIEPNESVRVAFAFLAGDNLSDLSTSAENAQIRYDEITAIESFPIVNGEIKISSFPNPAEDITTFSIHLNTPQSASLTIYNSLGEQVAQVFDGQFSAGNYLVDFDVSGLASGVYVYSLQTGKQVVNKQLVIKH